MLLVAASDKKQGDVIVTSVAKGEGDINGRYHVNLAALVKSLFTTEKIAARDLRTNTVTEQAPVLH